jgi:signal transduction histidine kinase
VASRATAGEISATVAPTPIEVPIDEPVTVTSGPDTGVAHEALTVATASLVVDIASAAAGEVDLERILFATLGRLGGLVRFTGGSIAIVDGDDLVIRAAVGPFADEALGHRVRRGNSRSWHVVESREPFVTGDLRTVGQAIRTPAAEGAVRSWLAVPLVRRGVGIGLLEVDSTEAGVFGEADVQLMLTIARVLSGPVDLARRYEDEQRAAALREAFIGVISHELRTPITTIYGTSRVLRARGDTLPSEQRTELVADIEAEADRLYRLVEDLLVLSRAERGHVELAGEPILLGHVLRRAVEAERPRWPDRTFEIRGPSILPAVAGEETYAEQILRNLLSNAAKYSPSGETVTVQGDVDNDEVRIRVLDRGMGISADDSERLFELFYRAPDAARQAAGAGIGLFVVRELVRAMGGRVWATPRDGGGSEFGIAMPIAPLDDD